MKSFEQYISESYSFRLGGSQKKGFNQAKVLNQLEEGDVFYYAMYDIRPGMNNGLFCIRSYKFSRKEKIDSENTKFFIIKKGRATNYFIIPNKDLDSTLSISETDASRCIISTDKDEFFEEVNKATHGSWSEKDLFKEE